MTTRFDWPVSGKKIWVAGHRGMVGSAMVRRLQTEDCEIITATRAEVDLLDKAATADFCKQHAPDSVLMCAAMVGGIKANTDYPVDFLLQNLELQNNVLMAAHNSDVDRLVFLGSTCIYPRDAEQPLREEALLTGPLETTNEWYAIAKIAGIKLCQALRQQYGRHYISVMPSNLYGPGDNYHPEHSHVVAALLRKFHEAKQNGSDEVIVWGTGTPRREFLYVDDMANACITVLKSYDAAEIINVGVGHDITIAELAETIAKTIDYQGTLRFDPSYPDGTPRKLVDNTKLAALGWQPKMLLADGLRLAYKDFMAGWKQRTPERGM